MLADGVWAEVKLGGENLRLVRGAQSARSSCFCVQRQCEELGCSFRICR
jgi:hypothetical protein